MLIQKPYILPASMQPLHDVIVEERNVWVCDAGWSRVSNTDEIKYRYSLYMECKDCKYKDFDKLVEQFSADEAHNYPFVEADKEDADRFFELLTANDEYSFTLLDYNENLMSPIILLESS